MGQVISRRVYPLFGEVEESTYEAGHFYMAGQDLNDVVVELQRETFAFVADEAREVMVTFVAEVGPEGSIREPDVSGVARFIGVGLQNGQPVTERVASSWMV
jgi:hypothetical protein